MARPVPPQSVECPCCGGTGRLAVNGDSYSDPLLLELPPTQRKIYMYLRSRPDGVNGIWAVADHVYGDRADGGPDWGGKSVSTLICGMRPKLARYGLRIGNYGARGHSRYGIWPIEGAP